MGALVGNQQGFLSGIHLAFAVAGGVLVLGLLSAWGCISKQSRRFPTDEVSREALRGPDIIFPLDSAKGTSANKRIIVIAA